MMNFRHVSSLLFRFPAKWPFQDIFSHGRTRSLWVSGAFIAILMTCDCLIAQTPSEQTAGQDSESPRETQSGVVPGTGDDVKVSVAVGGLRRYVPGRWGAVSATVVNQGKEEIAGLIVVTPKSSGGIQFARKVAVPPEMTFLTSWPVRIDGRGQGGLIDMEYLYFPSGKEDGEIRRSYGESALPSISGMMAQGTTGISAIVPNRTRGFSRTTLQSLMRAMRFQKLGDTPLAVLLPGEIGSQREPFDAIDQLAIADPQLLHYPDVCDTIRGWVNRGGRLLIAMDECGPEVAQYLLGGTMTVSVVGEVFPTSLTLDLNPDYPHNQYPVRSVQREFIEPVRYLRVVCSGGEPIWLVDGWPVAMRVPMGLGTVTLTTIQSDVFIEPRQSSSEKPEASHDVIASSRRMLDAMFNPRVAPLISETAAAAHAAAAVGYQIPDRSLATGLLIVFPVLLVVAGSLLQRREQGQRLIVVLPILAMLAAVPAVVIGARMRAVAPTTVIETSVIASAPGETQLTGDGFASIYLPESGELPVQSTNGTVMNVVSDSTNQDYKRLVWDDPVTSHWENLEQHVGLKTHMFRFEKSIPAAIQAFGSFDENGLVGTVKADGLNMNSSMLLAAELPVHMSLDVRDGRFSGASGDILAAGQYFKSSMVSDENRFQAALMHQMFNDRETLEFFPSQPTLFFWINPDNKGFQTGGEAVRRQESALVVQPLELTPPEAGRLVTIPAPFLPYRSVVTGDGSYSSVFNNQSRKWADTESAATTRLQFDVPSACLPFEVQSAEVTVTIRAASRNVTFRWGDPASGFSEVKSIVSPLGTVTLPIAKEFIAGNRSGKLFLEFHVSEAGVTSGNGDAPMSGEQDDSWKIDRLMLTITGRRMPAAMAN